MQRRGLARHLGAGRAQLGGEVQRAVADGQPAAPAGSAASLDRRDERFELAAVERLREGDLAIRPGVGRYERLAATGVDHGDRRLVGGSAGGSVGTRGTQRERLQAGDADELRARGLRQAASRRDADAQTR